MTLNRKDYTRKAKHHKTMINIRLRCIMPGRKPTAKDVEDVLLQILDSNSVPLGWQVAFVEWGNPKGGSTQWKPANGRGGDIGDIREFHAVINHELERNRIKMGFVRNDRLTGEEL
jgi:hypothetical protein